MTLKTISIVTITAFIMGFGTSRLLTSPPSDQGPPKQPDPENVTISKSVRKPSDRSTTRTQRLDSLLSEMEEISDGERTAKLAGMDIREIQRMVEKISSRREQFRGLDNTGIGMLAKLVVAWGMKDRDAAVEWVMGMGSERDRQRIVRALIRAVAKENLEEGLALMESLPDTYGERSAQPWTLLPNVVRKDADAMVRLFRASSTQTGPTMNYSLKYAEDFDFETALNGLADLQDSTPAGERFVVIPENLLAEWTKRDPQGALDWVLLGKDVDSNSGVSDLMASYKTVATEAELVAMVSDIHETQDGYGDTLDALSGIGTESALQQFFDETGAGGSQNQLMEGLLKESISNRPEGNATVRKMILARMDSQQRMAYFTGDNGPKPATPAVREQVRDQLRQLGHSAEEIDRMMKP